MTAPSATRHEYRRVAAITSATTGSSNAPGTQITSMAARETPVSRQHATAPSRSRDVISSLYRLTRIATRPVGRRRAEKSGTGSVREEVAELVALDLEIPAILVVQIGNERDARGDLESVSLETDQLPGIVGHHADRRETKVAQDLRTDTVIAEIRSEPEPLVGLDRIGAGILKRVRPQLV